MADAGRRALAVAFAVGLVGGGAAVWGWSGRAAPPVPVRSPLFEEVSAAEPPRQAARDDAPHVVLIMLCTTRRDQTSVYDRSLGTTPFLASLASQGVVLDDLVNAAPWTKVASTAILTGRHAVSVGMVEPSSRRNERVLPDAVTTLAEAFHGVGYRTVGVTTNPNLQSDYGFHVGFERYLQPARRWRGDRPAKIRGRAATEALLGALESVRGQGPVYVQAMLIDAHKPFVDGAGFAEEGLPDEVAAYRATLALLDDEVRHLVEQLRPRLGDHTIWMVVNDHGEGLSWPEHHGAGHGRFLYPSSVGGLGFVVGPGVPVGGRVGVLASQIDLAPTLWGLAGQQGGAWEGVDLGPWVRGEGQGVPHERVWADTWFHGANRAAVYTADRHCQVELQIDPKGAGPGFPVGCFDRVADPRAEAPFEDPALLGSIRAWREQVVAAGEAFAPGPRAVDPGVAEQLEALGYVDDPD